MHDIAENKDLNEPYQLLRRLHRANEQLQQYGHVNKKAFEQYGIFTKQRDQLTTRKEELDTTAEVNIDTMAMMSPT